MKRRGLSRQMFALVAAFSAVALGVSGTLAYLSSRSLAAAQDLVRVSSRQGGELMDVVAAAIDLEAASQRLVREKDPDALEKLIGQRKEQTSQARTRIRALAGAGSEAETGLDQYDQTIGRTVETLLKGEYGLAQQSLLEDGSPAFDKFMGSLQKLQQSQSLANNQRSESSISQTRSANFTVLAGVAVLLAALTALALVQVRRLNGSLGRAVESLRQSADQLSGAAAQVGESAQTLAQASTEQAGSLAQASQATEQIHSLTKSSSGHTQTIDELMDEAGRVVAQTNERLEQMGASMANIAASSGKISKILKVIDEIAFQTNILALNAAVEAARAGEAGMGFAVVAGEVRSLAQRSAQAAQETAALIEESMTGARTGVERLDGVVGAMRSVTESAAKVKSLVKVVAEGAREQERGMDRIAGTVAQLDQTTQSTAASAEEGAAAGEELSAQAESLRTTVEDLRVLVQGES